MTLPPTTSLPTTLMTILGPHADFIVAAYATAVIIVVALIAWVTVDYRRQNNILADLERRGLTRRSARKESR